MNITITIGLSPTLEAWLHSQSINTNATLTRLEMKIDAAIIRGSDFMTTLDAAITDLQAKVQADTTVIGSAVTLINGFGAQLADAVANAKAAGATDAQLASLTTLGATIEANNSALAAAVAAGTSAPVPLDVP